jgi:hypothetical protein
MYFINGATGSPVLVWQVEFVKKTVETMQNITADTSLKGMQAAGEAQEKRTGFSGRETIRENNRHGISGTGDDPLRSGAREEDNRIAVLRETGAA